MTRSTELESATREVISLAGKSVKLTSKDGDTYTVPVSVARLSKMVEDTIQCGEENADDENDEGGSHEVILPNVRSPCLMKVIDFCEHYINTEALQPIESPLTGHKLEDIVKQEWYRDFVNLEQKMIFELVTAANYMDIKPLLDLTCLVVSLSLMGKNTEEIRYTLNIPAMSEEELRRARNEHRWIFDNT